MKMQGQLKQKQRGAVLIVALLLLLVTTFIGFSAMETSNLEAKMATAREIKEQTFQTAENVIEQAIDNIPLIASAYATFLQSSTNWPTSSYSFTHDSNLSGDIEPTTTNSWVPDNERIPISQVHIHRASM
jgi:type IV pilus assembly protein PilX